jgi:hypothetical protein
MPGPGKSTVDATFTMRVSLQKRFRFQKDTVCDAIPGQRPFDVVAALPPSQAVTKTPAAPPKMATTSSGALAHRLGAERSATSSSSRVISQAAPRKQTARASESARVACIAVVQPPRRGE